MYRQYLENHHYYIRVVSESCVFVQYFQFRDLVRERFRFFCWAEISIWCNMSLTHLFTDSGTLHLVLNKAKSSLSVTTVLTSAYKVKSSRLSVTRVLCMQSPLRWAFTTPCTAMSACFQFFSTLQVSFNCKAWGSIAKTLKQYHHKRQKTELHTGFC